TMMMSYLPSSLRRHWPPTSGVLQRLARAKGGTFSWPNLIGPVMVWRSTLAIDSTIAAGSFGSAARFSVSTANSNSEWMKPIGCVHCRPVALVKPAASSAAVCPLSEDLNGCAGDHQTSDERLLPVLPSASSATGNRIALPTLTTFGLKPFWLAWFQKVVKSGG